MSNRLSVVRTLCNSKDVRASMGGNMQFHGKIMNFASLTHQAWQGIYNRKQLLELKPQEISLHGGPKPVQDTKRLNYGNMTLQRTTDIAHRAWAISQGSQSIKIDELTCCVKSILSIYNGRGGIVRKRRRERPKPHCFFFSLLVFFLNPLPPQPLTLATQAKKFLSADASMLSHLTLRMFC